jgi:hypothetical protein
MHGTRVSTQRNIAASKLDAAVVVVMAKRTMGSKVSRWYSLHFINYRKIRLRVQAFFIAAGQENIQ